MNTRFNKKNSKNKRERKGKKILDTLKLITIPPLLLKEIDEINLTISKKVIIDN
jgi:hypothetical protein